MRDFWDGEFAVDLSAVGSLSRPFQLDLAVVDRDEPVRFNTITTQLRTSQQRQRRESVLRLALPELNVPIHIHDARDRHRVPALLDRHGRQLALEPRLGPWRDVLVLPVPVGRAERHRRHRGARGLFYRIAF